MANGTPQDPSRPTGSRRHSLANGHRLEALGEAIDRKAVTVSTRRPRKKRSVGRRVGIVGLVLVGLLATFVGGGYVYAQYKFSKIHKTSSAGEVAVLGNQPFNILEIGSDSRVGLSGVAAAMSGANGYSSQAHSDVVKIMHVDPVTKTIVTLSIPRDTLVTMLQNQSTYGAYNRLNVTLGVGPQLLAQTITANFGIPIAHTIEVSFAGIINAASAIGGVRLDFPYPARDTYSGLRIRQTGCQTISRFQALALVRSRHYEWYEHGMWNTDVTSDYGRIYRQDNFIKAFINKAKHLWNPLTINSLLSNLPQGISLDSNFTLNDLIGLALKFHSLNTNSMTYYTLPTEGSSQSSPLGDVLYVQEPAAEQTLVKIFGAQLLRPTNPPPNTAGQPTMPPVITIPKPVTHPTSKPGTPGKPVHRHPVTTTTVEGDQWFNPVPC